MKTPFQTYRGLILFVVVVATCAHTSLAGEVTFRRTGLTTEAETNMGDVPVADINGDEIVDIVAGLQWFEGPSWKRHPFYPPDSKPTAIDIGFTIPSDLDIFAGKSRYRHGDPGNGDPLDVFWLELVRSGDGVAWVKHQLATDLTMGIPPSIADVDADGDMDLVLRGHGIGGHYVIGARQTDVIVFIAPED